MQFLNHVIDLGFFSAENMLEKLAVTFTDSILAVFNKYIKSELLI